MHAAAPKPKLHKLTARAAPTNHHHLNPGRREGDGRQELYTLHRSCPHPPRHRPRLRGGWRHRASRTVGSIQFVRLALPGGLPWTSVQGEGTGGGPRGAGRGDTAGRLHGNKPCFSSRTGPGEWRPRVPTHHPAIIINRYQGVGPSGPSSSLSSSSTQGS